LFFLVAQTPNSTLFPYTTLFRSQYGRVPALIKEELSESTCRTSGRGRFSKPSLIALPILLLCMATFRVVAAKAHLGRASGASDGQRQSLRFVIGTQGLLRFDDAQSSNLRSEE